MGEWWDTTNTPARCGDVVVDPNTRGLIKACDRDRWWLSPLYGQTISAIDCFPQRHPWFDNVILGTVRLELEAVRGCRHEAFAEALGYRRAPLKRQRNDSSRVERSS